MYQALSTQNYFLSTVLTSEKDAILCGQPTPCLTNLYRTNLLLRRNLTIITDIPLAEGLIGRGNKTLLWITLLPARTPNRLEGIGSHFLRLS